MTSRRFSIPYFVLPDDDAVVFPQPTCVDVENSARYQKVTLASYAEQMAKWQYEKARITSSLYRNESERESRSGSLVQEFDNL